VTLATAETKRLWNWQSRQPFFVRRCENATEFETFCSQVAFVVPQIGLCFPDPRNDDICITSSYAPGCRRVGAVHSTIFGPGMSERCQRLSSEAELTAKPVHNLVQHFNLFEKVGRSLALVRVRNERIRQISVIFHPISALCEPFLGKRDKILSGDHRQIPWQCISSRLGATRRAISYVTRGNDH